MNKAQAQRLCDKLNKKERDVEEHRLSNANAVTFWANCKSTGNFIITGGNEAQRADMLVRMLENSRSRSSDAIVLLTTSDLTERAVTKAAQENRLGSTVISSSRFPNYHPLYRMDSENIRQLLMSIANLKNYKEMDKLENYITAFMAISDRYFPPSLYSMIRLDQQFSRIHQLLALGEASHISQDLLEAISNYPEGRTNLRRLMAQLYSAYQNISRPSLKNRANLLTAVSERKLICVSVKSTQPQIMDMALSAELEQVIGSGQSFTLILNDVPLRDAETLYKQIVEAKNVHSRIHVGICTQNASTWAKSVPRANNSEDALLKNTQHFALFHNPDDSDGDLDEVLKYLGTYPKHEVVMGGGHGAGPIHLFHAGNWQVAVVGVVNRVAPKDLDGYGVLLKGHRGRSIDLYRGIII